MVQEGDTSLQPEPSGVGTSQPITAMEVSEDEADEALLKLNEDELRNQQKVNSIQCIEGMRLLPKEASRFDIPLCRMIYMPLVRPTLAQDIKRLEAEFTNGYRPGAAVFYVSTTNENGEERLVKDVDTSSWDPHWTLVNDEFEAKLALHPHLKSLCGRMFFICDGNHRFKAWTGYIDRLHQNDREWHYMVDSICLDTKDKVALLLNAMHDINKSNEHSHVKTSMVHTLHRVKSVGCMPLESLKIWLTEEEYKRCANNPYIGKTWYPLTTDIFIALLFRQEIGEASDDAARKYYDETPKENWSDPAVTAAMRAAAKLKHQKFKGQFFKYLSIANPKFGNKFLEEITKHWSNNEKPEMSLEKLQLIATACVAPEFKVRWLKQWNSSVYSRQAVHFPPKGFSERDLEGWLNKASFWAGLEEAADDLFSKAVKDDSLPIDLDVAQKPRSISQYIQAWHNQVWEMGFVGFFKGKESYTKKKAFVDQKQTNLAVKRVVYRYFKRELLPLGAIEEPYLPQYLSSWIDKNSPHCMYNVYLACLWSISHLRACCWYIDCGKTFCPVEEEDAKKACDQDDSKTPDQGEVQEDEVEVERIGDAEKAKAKTDREAEKAKTVKDKAKKAGGRSGRTKAGGAKTPTLVLPEASIGSMSQNPRKRDSSFVELLASRLQQCTSPAFQDCSGETLHLDELFLSTSLEATMSYLEEHKAFPKEWLELQAFLVKHKSDKARAFKGVQATSGGVDLMVVDIPEDLPVPTVTSPSSSVPEWNKLPHRFVETVFEIASRLVHDNGVLLLFHPDDLQIKADIRGCLKPYHFSVFKEFVGVNRLPLTSARNASKITLRFCIQLFVRSFPGVPASTFSISPVPELDSIGINVADDDVLFNMVTKDTQLMRGTSPWRGGREKDPILLRMLIESTTQFGDTVLDCNASTGASVHACRKAGRHFVAMEADQMIFKAILEPLIEASVPEVSKKQRLDTQEASEILMDEELAESSIVARDRFSQP